MKKKYFILFVFMFLFLSAFNGYSQSISENMPQQEHIEGLSIYPNPVSTSINFSGLSSDNPILKIELFSNSGSVVQIQKGNTDSLDISHLSTGIYYINVYLQDGTVIYRAFIKS